MQRHRLAIIVSAALLAVGVGSATLVAQGRTLPAEHKARKLSGSQQFVGYWMGFDPTTEATPDAESPAMQIGPSR
jgi:hypothetical protein